MGCLAVWIGNVVLRWGLSQWRGGQEWWMRPHRTAPVVVRISVATSGTEFTAPEADFAPLMRGCWLLSWNITCVRSWNSAWRGAIDSLLAFPAANAFVFR
jgi:hypothetical protein